MSNLTDRLDADFPAAWRPKPDEKIVGTVVDVEMFDRGEYQPYPILTLDTDSGPIAVHCFHTVLKNELGKKAPQPGDRLGIKYLGKSDRGYESYRVVMETSREAPVNWDQLGAEAAAELGEAEPPRVPPTRETYGPDEAPF